jgi:hypothetical protein
MSLGPETATVWPCDHSPANAAGTKLWLVFGKRYVQPVWLCRAVASNTHRRCQGPHPSCLGTAVSRRTAVPGTHTGGHGHRAHGALGRACCSHARHCHLRSPPLGHSASPAGYTRHCHTGTRKGCRGALQAAPALGFGRESTTLADWARHGLPFSLEPTLPESNPSCILMSY